MSFKTYRGRDSGGVAPDERIVSYSGYGSTLIPRYSSRTLFADLCVPLLLLLNIQAIVIPNWELTPNRLSPNAGAAVYLTEEELTFGQTVAFPLLLAALGLISLANFALMCRATEFFVGRCTRIQIVTTGLQAMLLLAVTITEIIYKSLESKGSDSLNASKSTPGIRLHSIIHSCMCTLLALTSSGYKLYNLKIKTHRATANTPTMGELSANQRQLILLTVAMVVYIIFGGGLWVALEKRTFEGAIYFSLITVTSIGMDTGPKSIAGRIILLFYASIGMVIFGLTVYAIRSVLLDMFTDKLVRKLFALYLERQVKRSRKRTQRRDRKLKKKTKLQGQKDGDGAHDSDKESQSETDWHDQYDFTAPKTPLLPDLGASHSAKRFPGRSSSLSSTNSQDFLLPLHIPKPQSDAAGGLGREKQKFGSISVSPILSGSLGNDGRKLSPLGETHYRLRTELPLVDADEKKAFDRRAERRHRRIRKALSADMAKTSLADLSNPTKPSSSFANHHTNIFAPAIKAVGIPRRRSFSYSLKVHNPSFTQAIVEMPMPILKKETNFPKTGPSSSSYSKNLLSSDSPPNESMSSSELMDMGGSNGESNFKSPEYNFRFPDTVPATLAGESSVSSEDELVFQKKGKNAALSDNHQHLLVQFSKKYIYWQLAISFVTAIMFLGLFGMVYCFIEDWGYMTSLYFCFSASSTIGYGDIALRTIEGRTIFIWMVFFGVGVFTWFVSVLSDCVTGWWKERVILSIQSRVYKRIEKRQLMDGLR